LPRSGSRFGTTQRYRSCAVFMGHCPLTTGTETGRPWPGSLETAGRLCRCRIRRRGCRGRGWQRRCSRSARRGSGVEPGRSVRRPSRTTPLPLELDGPPVVQVRTDALSARVVSYEGGNDTSAKAVLVLAGGPVRGHPHRSSLPKPSAAGRGCARRCVRVLPHHAYLNGCVPMVRVQSPF
jgi:hypothetical protein